MKIMALRFHIRPHASKRVWQMKDDLHSLILFPSRGMFSMTSLVNGINYK